MIPTNVIKNVIAKKARQSYKIRLLRQISDDSQRRALMRKSLIFIILTIISLAASLYAGVIDSNLYFNLDSIDGKYEPVRFNHTKHISLAGDCSLCHHQHSNSGTLPCKDCHAVTPSVFKDSVVNGFMACKNCHGVSNPQSPEMPGLKAAYHQACFKCHLGMGDVGKSPKGCTDMCHAIKGQKVSIKSK